MQMSTAFSIVLACRSCFMPKERTPSFSLSYFCRFFTDTNLVKIWHICVKYGNIYCSPYSQTTCNGTQFRRVANLSYFAGSGTFASDPIHVHVGLKLELGGKNKETKLQITSGNDTTFTFPTQEFKVLVLLQRFFYPCDPDPDPYLHYSNSLERKE